MHCGYYPSWNLRFFRHQLGRYEQFADVSATGADDAALKSAKTRAAAITQCLADAGVAPKRLSSRQVAIATPEPRTILRIEPIVK